MTVLSSSSKFVVSVISFYVLSSVCHASMDTLMKQLNGLAAATGDRGFVGTVLKNFNGYGCWCYFEENENGAVEKTGIGYGKSQPVNQYDAACKILHGGYECIVADQAALGQSCEPWTATYNFPTADCLVNGPGPVDCCEAINTPGSCAADTCIVERQFAVDMLNLLNELNVPTEFNLYQHSNGFDPGSASCPIVPGLPNPTTACCGDYPQRFPYKTLNDARKCCDVGGIGITFMDATWDCCNDGIGPNGCPND